MKVTTSRFGDLEIKKEDILTFKEGILGFEKLKKFFVVDPNDQTLILWLQSVEDSTVAFPVLEPKIFCPDYVVELLPAEMNSLNLNSLDEAAIYSVLTIPQNVTEMSANMKAPIVINTVENTARQIVLQNSKLEVRLPMYQELKKCISNFSDETLSGRKNKIKLHSSSEEAQS